MLFVETSKSKESRAATSSRGDTNLRGLLSRRERTMAGINLLHILAGVAICTSVLAVFPRCVLYAAYFFDIGTTRDPRQFIAGWHWMAIDGALLVITLPIALFTHRQSRADSVNQFMNSGSSAHAHCPSDLLALIVAMIACLGLLQGEFLLIDALKISALRWRLAGVDRARAANILGRLIRTPAGVEPIDIQERSETPEHFRRVIAYLMAYQWVNLSAKGDHLMLLSPAQRALRA